MDKEVIKIANCSGYYGDKLSAAKELVDGGPIDVLTGDYLAELTMAILYGQRIQRGDDKGYVGTFLKQIKEVAASCKEKKIKIVSNAGGLNPKSMAGEIEKILVDATKAKNYIYQVTGLGVLYNNLLQSLFTSQIKSLIFVFTAIFIMLLILFKNILRSIFIL